MSYGNWQEMFEPRILQRGHDYYKGGKVRAKRSARSRADLPSSSARSSARSFWPRRACTGACLNM